MYIWYVYNVGNPIINAPIGDGIYHPKKMNFGAHWYILNIWCSLLCIKGLPGEQHANNAWQTPELVCGWFLQNMLYLGWWTLMNLNAWWCVCNWVATSSVQDVQQKSLRTALGFWYPFVREDHEGSDSVFLGFGLLLWGYFGDLGHEGISRQKPTSRCWSFLCCIEPMSRLWPNFVLI